MAKITSIQISEFPNEVIINDKKQYVVEAEAVISFHSQDLSNNMEYLLYIHLYDINLKKDVPVLLSNWDDSILYNVSNSRRDYCLGECSKKIKATEEEITIKKEIPIHVDFKEYNPAYELEINALASLIPAIGSASKWSKSQTVNVER